MASGRKLMAEVDRTLKKVNEGVDIFDEIWDKVYAAPTQSLKEKHEADLKKEIKKLQRFRDSIKSWIVSSDIKETGTLMKARKLIETKMEQFKVCERETKTKAFSKEGLAQAAKLDPSEIARSDARSWTQGVLQSLADQVDAMEADIERISSSKGRKRDMNRVAEIEGFIEQHKWHIEQLEKVIRALDNDLIEPEDLDNVKEDVDFYVESGEEGTLGDMEPDEFMYDDLELDSLLGQTGAVVQVDPKAEESARKEKEQAAEMAKAAAKEEKAQKKKEHDKLLKQQEERQKLLKEQQEKQRLKKEQQQKERELREKQRLEEQKRKAAVDAAGAVPGVPRPEHVLAAPLSVAEIVGGATKPTLAATLSAAQENANLLAQQRLAAAAEKLAAQQQQQQAAAKQAEQLHAAQQQQETLRQQQQQQQEQQTMKHKMLQQQEDDEQQLQQQQQQQQQQHQQQLAQQQQQHLRMQQALGVARQQQQQQGLDDEEIQLLSVLESSGAYAPSVADSAPPAYHMQQRIYANKSYKPKYPMNTPAVFPQTPHPVFSKEAVFAKMDPDTLFLVFYHQQASYQQYLAATTLKKLSWRYHKKYMTWFQRHEEPQTATKEYELGTYVYFDYESTWCKRIKSEFTFEYAFLEDEAN